MDIRPPYGYTNIAPLTKTQRVQLPSRGVPDVFARMNAIPLSFSEIPVACRDYPIAFVTGDAERSFLVMAILGLEQGQNLFITGDGEWAAGVYLPAYVRRYPFCMAKVISDGAEQADRIVCVEQSALAEDGEALFDDRGEALPKWQETQKLLFEFEADLTRAEAMCSALKNLGLLEPFTVQAMPTGGGALALTGMHRVSEQKLAELAGDELKTLTQNGVLSRVYAQILSQLNFQRLLDRRAQRTVPAGATLQ